MTLHGSTTGRSRTRTAALLVAACTLVAGCDNGGATATLTATEQSTTGVEPTAVAITSVAGTQDADGAVVNDGETSTNGGASAAVGTGLPEGFPAEVPVIDGEIVSSAQVDNEDAFGWVLQVLNEDADAHERAVQAVAGAGFAPPEGVPEVSAGALTSVILLNDDWQVVVASLEGQDIVSYTVTALDR